MALHLNRNPLHQDMRILDTFNKVWQSVKPHSDVPLSQTLLLTVIFQDTMRSIQTVCTIFPLHVFPRRRLTTSSNLQANLRLGLPLPIDSRRLNPPAPLKILTLKL